MKFWPHSVPGLLLHLAVSSRGSQEWLLHRFQLWARPLGQHRDSTGQTLAAQGILQGTPTLPDFPQWSCSVPQGLLHPCCSLCPRYQTLFWPHSWPWSPAVTHTALSAFCHLPSHLCQSFSYPKCSYLQTACPRHIYIYIPQPTKHHRGYKKYTTFRFYKHAWSKNSCKPIYSCVVLSWSPLPAPKPTFQVSWLSAAEE